MSGLKTQLANDGFLSRAIALAEPGLCARVLSDGALADAAMLDFEQRGVAGVPYMLTESIALLAQDAAIVETVQALLATEHWVMWGANIRRSVPNEAQNWHVDLESILWPSITVAVGLDGCSEQSATVFIPGTQRIGKGPVNWLPGESQTTEVVASAQSLTGQSVVPQRVTGYSDGTFAVFNGACWHQANKGGSAAKTVLYLHYQTAADKRIPHMLDYAKHDWSAEACPYFGSKQARECGLINPLVHKPPLRHRFRQHLRRVREWMA